MIAKSAATGAYGNADKRATLSLTFCDVRFVCTQCEGPTNRAGRVQILRDAGARWKRLPECEKAKSRTTYFASCASVGGCGVSQPSHPRQEPRHEQIAVACPSAELSSTAIQQSRGSLCTDQYRPPELLRVPCAHCLSPQVDSWGLGCTVFEAGCG